MFTVAWGLIAVFILSLPFYKIREKETKFVCNNGHIDARITKK